MVGKAAQIVMYFIISASRIDDYEIIEQMLMEADLSKLSSRSMTAMVRSCWVFRDKILFWQTLYLDVWKQLLVIGSDPYALFIGMPIPNSLSRD